MPKRKCTSQNTNNESDNEIENYIDELVESAIANEDSDPDPTVIVTSILDFIISSVVKPKSGVYKRKFSLGRKTKDPKRFSHFRNVHESQSQYEARLKMSTNLKAKMKKMDEGVHHERKLEILKEKR